MIVLKALRICKCLVSCLKDADVKYTMMSTQRPMIVFEMLLLAKNQISTKAKPGAFSVSCVPQRVFGVHGCVISFQGCGISVCYVRSMYTVSRPLA